MSIQNKQIRSVGFVGDFGAMAARGKAERRTAALYQPRADQLRLVGPLLRGTLRQIGVHRTQREIKTTVNMGSHD